MSEKAPISIEQGEIPKFADVNLVDVGSSGTRFQGPGSEFISMDVAEQSRTNARDVLFSTIDELKDQGEQLNDQDLKSMVKELGLEDEFTQWHGNSAVKTFRIEDLKKAHEEWSESKVNPTQASLDEKQHASKQAAYDEMFSGKSQNDIDREVEASGWRRKSAEATKAVNNSIAERNAAGAAKKELKDASDLQNKNITELSELLGEKPSFSASKAELIARVKAKQKEITDEEPVDLVTPAQPDMNNSTLETVAALKKFQTSMGEAKTKKELEEARIAKELADEEAARAEEQAEIDAKKLTESLQDEPINNRDDPEPGNTVFDTHDANGTPVAAGSLAGSTIDRATRGGKNHTRSGDRVKRAKKRLRNGKNSAAVAASRFLGGPKAEINKDGQEKDKGFLKRNIGKIAIIAAVAGAVGAYKAGLHEKAGEFVGDIFNGNGDQKAVMDSTSPDSMNVDSVNSITPSEVLDLQMPEIEASDLSPENNGEVVNSSQVNELTEQMNTYEVPGGGSITGAMVDNLGLNAEQAKYVYDHIPTEEWLKLPNTYDMGQNGWVGIGEAGEGAFSFGDLTARVLDLAEEAKEKS